ncbi:MAG TPA: WecB/TagA/CpsF family glycosyltransferase [Burkholderiales bacterium]|nr:WecB/TagA/CpsF family glycosyltransferase [Burkholderiales bacterium]
MNVATGCSNEGVSICGVRVSNFSQEEAIALIHRAIVERVRGYSIYIANTHTFNLASDDQQYHAVLNRASKVFADGTGARWAARMRGVRLKDNLVGTDLIPRLFDATAGKGYRYFLLGGGAEAVERAARACSRLYTGWSLAGFHHGYSESKDVPRVIDLVNSTRADLLLVAMGNPHQERWIDTYREYLTTPVCVGVGGLVDHWAGRLTRAPMWVRRHGFEWVQILLQQPHKWRRYILGNPKFLLRMMLTARRDRYLSGLNPAPSRLTP